MSVNIFANLTFSFKVNESKKFRSCSYLNRTTYRVARQPYSTQSSSHNQSMSYFKPTLSYPKSPCSSYSKQSTSSVHFSNQEYQNPVAKNYLPTSTDQYVPNFHTENMSYDSERTGPMGLKTALKTGQLHRYQGRVLKLGQKHVDPRSRQASYERRYGFKLLNESRHLDTQTQLKDV